MIDGVATRLVTYREGIDRVSALIGHRARLLATLPPLRDQFETAVADVPDRAVARTLFRGQNQIASALLSHDPAGAEQSAQGMRSQTIDEPSLRAAVNAYADAIIAISRTESEIVDLDRQVLGTQGRLIGRATELLRELSARRGQVLSRDFARTLAETNLNRPLWPGSRGRCWDNAAQHQSRFTKI